MAFLKIFGDWKGAREALNGVARHAKKVNAQIKSSFSGLNSFFSKVFSPARLRPRQPRHHHGLHSDREQAGRNRQKLREYGRLGGVFSEDEFCG